MFEDNPSTALVIQRKKNKGKRREDSGSFTCFPHAVFILILHVIARLIPARTLVERLYVEGKTSGTYARLTERKPFTSCGGFSLLLLLLYPPPSLPHPRDDCRLFRVISIVYELPLPIVEAPSTDNAA